MRRVTHVVVEGLFGRVTHDIDIRPDAPTILTAPNGAGKTHVLILLQASLALDVKLMLGVPFQRIAVTLADSAGIQVDRSVDEDGTPELRIQALKHGKSVGSPANVNHNDLESVGERVPPYIRPLDSGRWLDIRADRVMTREMVERRFKVRLRERPEDLFRNHAEILEVWSQAQPVLIDTKRLDAVYPPSTSRYENEALRQREGQVGAARITHYIDQLRAQVTEARRSSIQETQSADLSFAARALAAAGQTVQEGALHKRYDAIVDKYEDLARNGLAVGEAPMEFPSKTTPTVRRILNVFLDDWEKRLEPLLPVNQKLNALREILDTKLEHSGKKTGMSPRGELTFKTFNNRRIRVATLSSGEQHLVALFTMLLFSAAQGSLVLIDEPEISLHAAWKHSFLEDISTVASLADLQVVMATHSTAIVNGRWDLTEELEFPKFSEDERADSPIDDELETDEILG